MSLPSRHRSPSFPHAAAWLGMASWLGLAACAPPDAASEALALRSAQASSALVASVSLGEGTTCVTTEGGDAKCWGRADGGRLGLGVSVPTSMPDPAALEPLALGEPAEALATNGAQSFALLDDGSVRAFGLNAVRELGLGHGQTVGDDETPADAGVPTLVPLAGPAGQLAVGHAFACARLEDGGVQCWGRGDEGQLGGGPQPGIHGPTVVALGADAVEIAAGAAHACARLESGAIRCWGDGSLGRLGHGTPIGASGAIGAVAVDVPLGAPAVQIVAGGAHSCALLQSGAVRCWGDGSHGQLGYASTAAIGDDETPAAAGDVALGGPATQLVAGRRHTCALRSDGVLRCWGDGSQAQLGLPSTLSIGDDEHPIAAAAVDMGGAEVEAIFGGALADHTCAALDDGRLRCWGRNHHGQAGLGYTSPLDPVEGPPGDLPDVIIVEDPDA